MLLRMLREPRTGRPSPLARLIVFLLLVGMVGITAPILVVLARELAELL